MDISKHTQTDTTKYWSKFFGIDSSIFSQPGSHFFPHSALGDYRGVWIFKRNESLVISCPNDFLPTCESLLNEVAPANLFDLEILKKCFASNIETIIGPAYHGALEKKDFKPLKVSDGREISFQEAEVLNDGSDPRGWEWSGCGKEKSHYFGIFQDNVLVSVSNYSIKDGVLAFPGIYTRPASRGLGLSKPALSLAFQHLLEAGLIMDYQTLSSNIGAIKSAESLGVKKFAQHIAIRLK